MNRTVAVAGIPFCNTSQADAASAVLGLARDRSAVSIRLANAYSVASACADPNYLHLMRSTGINFPDGLPVVWFMRLSKESTERVPGRVRGPSLFLEVLDRGQPELIRHSFIGTTSDTLRNLKIRATERFPRILIAEAYAPPFSSNIKELVESIIENVNVSECDILWVALGTPKQDFVAAALSERTGLPCIAVGAAFDFLAGTVPEAPRVYQRLGIEWLFRLRQDPKRLWRRYTFGSATFVYQAFKYRLFGEVSCKGLNR